MESRTSIYSYLETDQWVAQNYGMAAFCDRTAARTAIGHSACSEMVYRVTPSGVVLRRDRLHNARDEQRSNKGATFLD